MTDIDVRTARDRAEDAELYRLHRYIFSEKMRSFGIDTLARAWTAFSLALFDPPAPPAAPDESYTIDEIAERVHRSRGAVIQWCRERGLGRWDDRSRRYYIRQSELDQFQREWAERRRRRARR
jgi:hypothetical protein